MMRVLSLGAGVQSSTLLLMAASGDLEHVPDCAIFADTGWEPQRVYDWLNWLEGQVAGRIPIHRVSAGSIREAVYTAKTSGARYATLPLYVLGRNGQKGIQRRQCTREFKIEPQVRKIRELLGLAKGQRGPAAPVLEQWFGISMDEVVRVKDSRYRYIVHRYPLIDLGWTRGDCLAWWDRAGLPRPPKSACIACPYRRNAEWQRMKEEDPAEFADAVAFDHAIREGQRGLHGQAFVHDSRLPLDEVDFTHGGWTGQETIFDAEFADECEGMCGV